VELGDARALRHQGAHVRDDALGDVEVVLPERTGRIVDRGAPEAFDDRGRPAPAHEIWAEDRVGARDVQVAPEAVQRVAETGAHVVQARGERLDPVGIGDQHDLRRPRGALDDDLQVTREPAVRRLVVAAHAGLDERLSHDRGHAVDQRVLDAALRDGHDAVRPELEHAEGGPATPAADREPRAVPEPGGRAADHPGLPQAVGARETLQRLECRRRESRLAVAGAAGARRSVRAGGQARHLARRGTVG
jgi:hypothetical protein